MKRIKLLPIIFVAVIIFIPVITFSFPSVVFAQTTSCVLAANPTSGNWAGKTCTQGAYSGVYVNSGDGTCVCEISISTPTCVAGWSEESLVFDGPPNSGVGWCNDTTYGECRPLPNGQTGGHEQSAKGSITYCCRGSGELGYLRECSTTPLPPLAPTPTLSVTSPIVSGDRSTLTWGWSGGTPTSCTAPSGNWSNSGNLTGSGLSDPLLSDTTFTYSCTNAGGTNTVTAVVIVTAPPPPPPPDPIIGSCSAFHYDCVSGTSANNSDTDSTKWTWNCNSIPSNTSTNKSCYQNKPPGATATVVVNISPGLDFYIAPMSTPRKTTANTSPQNLSFTSTNASDCTGSVNSVSIGSIGTSYLNWNTGTLAMPTTYTITCSGPGGTTPAKSVVITVPIVPSVNLYFTTP